MLDNRPATLDHFRASEGWTLRIGNSELGGASWCGVTLGSWGEYCIAEHLPVPTLADWKALDAQGTDVLTVDQVNAFYVWKVLDPIRFDDLPSGVDYAVADWCVNEGEGGCLNDLRRLFRTPLYEPHWRMDVALLKALSTPPPALVVDAICNMRWAMMEAASDFMQPSAVTPGKHIGDGRAFRMSEVHRGAMELIGFAPEAPRYAMPVLTPA